MAYKRAILLDSKNPSVNSSLVAIYQVSGQGDLAEEQGKYK
jgi:hypothetical protein